MFGALAGIGKAVAGGLGKAVGGIAQAAGGGGGGGAGGIIQGVTDLVGGIVGAAKGGGGEAQAAEGAEGAGAAKGGGGEAKAKKDPLQKLAEKLEKATTPEEVDKIVQKVMEKLGKKGGGDPQVKAAVEKMAEAKRLELAAPADL